MKEKRQGERGAIIFVVILLVALVVCVVLLAGGMKDGVEQIVRKSGKSREVTALTGETIEIKKVDFCIQKAFDDDVFHVEGKDGKRGLVDSNGNWLVEPEYEYLTGKCCHWYSFYNKNGDEKCYVFDKDGTLLYEYNNFIYSQKTKDGIEYYTWVGYRAGMRIEMDFPENADNYYAVRFYNAETKELIFENSGTRRQTGVTFMPNADGIATVIVGYSYQTTIYRITKDGYEAETFEETDVATRVYLPTWYEYEDQAELKDNIAKLYIKEYRGELFDYSEDSREVLFNIDTKEIMPLPEKYQNYAMLYERDKGTYYGIARTEEPFYDMEIKPAYYAICDGSRILSEEIYRWIDFGEKYIIAGTDYFVHILDYEGNVLAEYEDVGAPFVDGKTLVCDGVGVFFIDENLNRCSEYLAKNVDYCYPRSYRKGNQEYLVIWNEHDQEEE